MEAFPLIVGQNEFPAPGIANKPCWLIGGKHRLKHRQNIHDILFGFSAHIYLIQQILSAVPEIVAGQPCCFLFDGNLKFLLHLGIWLRDRPVARSI